MSKTFNPFTDYEPSEKFSAQIRDIQTLRDENFSGEDFQQVLSNLHSLSYEAGHATSVYAIALFAIRLQNHTQESKEGAGWEIVDALASDRFFFKTLKERYSLGEIFQTICALGSALTNETRDEILKLIERGLK